LTSSEEETLKREEELQSRAWAVLKNKVKEKTEHILYKMEKRFDDYFKLDENGLPIRWGPRDDIATKCTHARQMAYDLLDLFSIIRINPKYAEMSFFKEGCDTSAIPPDIIVLTDEQCVMARDRFKKESEAAYLQAMREQVAASQTFKVPPIMVVLLVVLGFNEFMMLLQNPLLLVLVVIGSLVAYVLWFVGLLDVPIGIASELTNQVMSSSKQWAINTVVQRVIKSDPPSPTDEKKEKKD